MDRPSRNKKNVNYSYFQDDDDEDFACVKPPPKKARTAIKDADPEENIKTPSPSPNETIALTSAGNKRVSLDDKRYESDLEAALTMSLLENTKTHDGEPTIKTDECSADDHNRHPQSSPPVLIQCSNDGIHSAGDGQPRPDSPPVLSNCSIDGRSLGLNIIDAASPKVSKQTKASEKQTKLLKEKKNNKEDDDYKPQNTPDSESDADFTGEDESEDETFTVKKKMVKQKIEKKATSATKDKKEKKEKKPAKASKAKSSASSPSVCQSPAAPVSGRKKTPTSPPVSKPVLCSSPAGGRLPKWTPPGLVGRNQNQNTPVKSPGQGLRLGLSRRARVKPLHPNVAAN